MPAAGRRDVGRGGNAWWSRGSGTFRSGLGRTNYRGGGRCFRGHARPTQERRLRGRQPPPRPAAPHRASPRFSLTQSPSPTDVGHRPRVSSVPSLRRGSLVRRTPPPPQKALCLPQAQRSRGRPACPAPPARVHARPARLSRVPPAAVTPAPGSHRDASRPTAHTPGPSLHLTAQQSMRLAPETRLQTMGRCFSNRPARCPMRGRRPMRLMAFPLLVLIPNRPGVRVPRSGGRAQACL